MSQAESTAGTEKNTGSSIEAGENKTGSGRLLLVAYELSDMPEIPQLWEKIAAAVGFEKDEVVLTVTHNHSSPNDSKIRATEEETALGERYKEIELSAGITACREAVSSLRPARYAYTEGQSFINVNRNYCSLAGEWLEAPNFAGFSDKTLAVFSFVDEEGKLIAAFLNHATHATNIFQQRDADGKTKLSGNFPGITCRFLEEYYGNGSVVMWTSGAAGNQNPFLVHGMLMEYSDGYCTEVAYPDGAGYQQMESIGRRHAADAVRTLNQIRDYSDKMELCHVKKQIDIPAQKRDDPLFTGPAVKPNIGYRKAGDQYRPPVYPKMADDPEHPVPLYMELLILGDTAIVCVGAELFAQLGQKIKEASPWKHTVVLTHTHYHIGYILDESSKDVRAQQSFGRIKPGAADELILEGVQEMFAEVKIL
ncbi:MAG: hypothetical protein LUD18_02820 [Lachnospiraceae bacterium]|nr:hypothetical protein [Lachnospiraceae bacterium]